MRFSQDWYNAYQARMSAKARPVEEPEQASAGTEAALHNAINEEIRRNGWLCFHGSTAHRTHRTVGEPDWVLLLPRGRILFIEAKTKSGKLSPGQQALAAHARKLGHTIHVVRSLQEFVALCHETHANDNSNR